ncbi:MAG: dihydrofolate reductase, partial [Rikenellaceae bacterium]
VWFSSGIHHHYANDKFIPLFSRAFYDRISFGIEHAAEVGDLIFDATLYPTRHNSAKGCDLIASSATNYYAEGITQAQVESFYSAKENPPVFHPISHGLNSQLVIGEDGELEEKIWRVGGMYSEAIEHIVAELELAKEFAESRQQEIISSLIRYYQTGDLAEFDRYSILWVEDKDSKIDFLNGFIEVYGDPLGRKGSWEAIVNFKNEEASHRTEVIAGAAQWFEDHAPISPEYRKPQVKGVSARVVSVAMLGGDCYPATPIGINLPNADWIRSDCGSKSVTIDNITAAYHEAAMGSGFDEEFFLREEDRLRIAKHAKLSDDLHTDLHECLGHGSGRLAEGITGAELKSYGSTLEEARADLFGLYYIGDEKMVELGLLPSLEAAWAHYSKFMVNAMMTQFARVELGKDLEESHMRNRKLIAEWCYEAGHEANVIEWVEQDGKRYLVVNDFVRLRELFGELLHEVQRIKSEGDLAAAAELVERYGVKIDPELHAEVRERYEALGVRPYNGFVNPEYELVMNSGRVVDVEVSYSASYVDQMMNYSSCYSAL